MIRPIAITSEYLMWKTDPKTKIRSDIIEYYYIQMALIKIASLLGAAYGGRAISLFSIPLIVENKCLDQIVESPSKSFHCIFVVCGIRNTSEYVRVLEEDCPLYFNRIFDIIGDMTDRYDGWMTNDGFMKILLIWKIELDSNEEESQELKQLVYEEKCMLCLVTILKS